MKILMINDKYESVGGAENYLIGVCEGLENLGHETAVIYSEGGAVRAKRKSFFVPNLEISEILEIIETEKPDIVNLQNVFNNDLYRLLPRLKPVVRYVHDHRTYSPGSASMHFVSNTICEARLSWWHQPFFAYRERCMSRNPIKIVRLVSERLELLKLHNNLQKILVNSNYVKNRLIQNGVSGDLIFVSPPFVNIPHDKEITKSEEPIVLYVGRLFVEKGVEYAIRAVGEISNARLWVVGDGWDRQRLERLTTKLGLEGRVKFFGWVESAKLAELYFQATLTVLPSIWPEPFGMSGIESLSYGKPVVAFKVGGIPEWLADNKVGFLVPRANEKELAKAIKTLLDNSHLRDRFGELGRKLVEEKFNKETHLKKLLEIYEESIKNFKSSSAIS